MINRFMLQKSGTLSLTESGETMHSHIGAWQEAKQVYVRPSGLRSRLANLNPGGDPLVLHDVGMGIAANAICAIEEAMLLLCAPPGTRGAELEVHSFEPYPEGIRLALSAPRGTFPFLDRNRVQVERLLSHGFWVDSSQKIKWFLHVGAYLDLSAKAPAPDIIFYDMFSQKSSPELWDLDIFQRIFEIAKPKCATLYTYCSNAKARAHMKIAGFTVAQGPSTEAKRETTIAFSSPRIAPVQLSEFKVLDDGYWKNKIKNSPMPLSVKNLLGKSLLGLFALAFLFFNPTTVKASDYYDGGGSSSSKRMQISTSPLGLINLRFNGAVDFEMSRDLWIGFKGTYFPKSTLYTQTFESFKDSTKGMEAGVRFQWGIIGFAKQSLTGQETEFRLKGGAYYVNEERTTETADRRYLYKSQGLALEPGIVAHMPLSASTFMQLGASAYFWMVSTETSNKITHQIIKFDPLEREIELRIEFNFGFNF